MDLYSVKKSIFVLGPMVPDYRMLFDALRVYGNRIRGIGIPFGQTKDQIVESIEIQVAAGVLGIRIWAGDLLKYPDVASILGNPG